MFVFTLGKSALRRAGLAVLCLACMAGAAAAVSHFTGDSAAAAADTAQKITSTQDIADFFTGRGLEVDLTTAAVDKVKIPRKWDESFQAFNTVVSESGLSLDKYKGKKVEKWTMLCPARSDGETGTYCVLLVYKKKPVGAYLLAKPGGEVTGLNAAASVAALTEEESAAMADFGADAPAEEAAAPAEEAPEEAPAAEASADMTETDAEAEAAEAAALPAEDDGAWPAE